jgi:hypothetical protein
MGRPKASFPPVPKLHSKNAKGVSKVRVYYGGRYFHLGSTDDEAGWRAEFARLLAVWSKDPGSAAPQKTESQLTVLELARDYMLSEDCSTDRSWRQRILQMGKILSRYRTEVAVAELTPRFVTEFLRWMAAQKIEEGRPRAGELKYSRTTLRLHLRALIAVVKWGVGNRDVPHERLAGIRDATMPRTARPAKVVQAMGLDEMARRSRAPT